MARLCASNQSEASSGSTSSSSSVSSSHAVVHEQAGDVFFFAKKGMDESCWILKFGKKLNRLDIATQSQKVHSEAILREQ